MRVASEPIERVSSDLFLLLKCSLSSGTWQVKISLPGQFSFLAVRLKQN